MLSARFVSRREVKHLLPATVLKLKSVRPQIWTTTVHEKLYSSVEAMTATEAKAIFLSECYLPSSSSITNDDLIRYDSNMAAIRHDLLCRAGTSLAPESVICTLALSSLWMIHRFARRA